jgi:transcriptional regulator with XRE-family HTH domain
MRSINEQLHIARKAKGWTQSELGERLGWAQARVSAVENGRLDPRLSSIVQMGRLLDQEIMLVPRALLPAVQTLISGKTEEPLWSADEEDHDSNDDKEGPAS